MISRLTEFQLRPGTIEDARAVMEDMRVDILAQPGMLNVMVIVKNDGKGYVITVVESMAALNANAARAASIWSKFAAFMTAMPTAVEFDVIANWRN